MSELPAFLGLDPEDSDPATAAAVVIPVPYDATSTWMKGADRGPAALLAASGQIELYDIETDSEPFRHGVATAEAVHCGEGPERLADLVDSRVDEVLGRDQLPVLLGGEHSVSIGAIRAAARRYPGMSVLQIDAHGDTRDSYHGSKFNHACVMARAREWCSIVQVGLRAIDREELDGMERERVFFAHELRDGDDWMDRAVSLLGDEVYVTIDLDAFDPSLVPATGTPEPGGMGWYQVNELLRRVVAARRVVGFDVVELLPQPGDHASEFVAAKLVHRMLAMIFAQGD